MTSKGGEKMKKTLLKSIGAIVAGFVVVFLLSVGADVILESTHVFPPITNPAEYTWQMLLFALIYRLAFTAVGGYVTALLSPNKPMKHALILAIIGFIFSLGGSIAYLDKPNVWYPILLTIFSPLVLLGGARIKAR